MSLLGPPETVGPWVPEVSAHVPEVDGVALARLGPLFADIIRSWRTDAIRKQVQVAIDAWRHLERRLLEGRVEAAEVRYALGLPMSATRGEVLAAIKARGATS